MGYITLKINSVEIPQYPTQFKVTIMDLDDSEASVRTADGTLTRDRIAVKRQFDLDFGLLSNSDLATLLTMMQDEFFDFYYPDPMTATYLTKTVYVGNRSGGIAIADSNGLSWSGLSFTLIER